MGNKLPDYLPSTRPSESTLIDPGNVLGKVTGKKLQSELKGLSYPANVIVLPKDHSGDNIVQLSRQILTSWKPKSNDILFIIDVHGRQLNVNVGQSLMSKGITNSEVNDHYLPQYFYPQAASGNFANAVGETLKAVDRRLAAEQGKIARLNQKTNAKESVNTYSSQQVARDNRTTHDDHVGQLSYIGGILFLAIVILLVITYRFRGKGEQDIDLRKSRDEYNEKMEKITKLFQEDPQKFFIRVAALICLGYAYIALAVLVLITFTLFTFVLLIKLPFLALKLGIPLLLVLGVVFRSFWVKAPPVDGFPLKKKEFPRLYEMVNEIATHISAPKVHQIQLVPDFNAAVTQRARLGLLGWHKNYLILGIQILKTCSYDEMRSILAHEMGHLAEGHSAKDAWIYRVQGVWYQLMQSLQRDNSLATVLFTRFFNWYVPLLESYTFPYRREQEYNADLGSVELVGPDVAAKTFLSMDLKDRFLETKYWSNVGDRFSTPEPPAVYAGMSNALKGKIEKQDAEGWLRDIFNKETNYEDSHPCTRDRVAAILKIQPEEVPEYAHKHIDELCVIDDPAFDRLFPDRGEELCAKLDDEYKVAYKDYWQERHENYLSTKKSLEELIAKIDNPEFTKEDATNCAYNSLVVNGFDSSRLYFLKAIEMNPDDAYLRQVYGQCLYDKQDPDCVNHLETAIKLDRSRFYDCGQMLYGFHKSRNEEDKARQYEEKLIDWMEEYYKSKVERQGVSKTDTFIEHGLNSMGIETIRKSISDQPSVKSAWAVRKVVHAFAEIPYIVIVVAFDKKKVSDPEVRYQILLNISAVIADNAEFTADFIIYDKDQITKNLMQAIDIIDGSHIFNVD